MDKKYAVTICAKGYSFTCTCDTAFAALEALSKADMCFGLDIDLDKALCEIAAVAEGRTLCGTYGGKWGVKLVVEEEKT